MSTYVQSDYPNRTTPRSISTGAAAWKMVASDGSVYDSYSLLLAAGKVAWPGSPADFPRGVPAMVIRTTTSAGNADGDVVLYKTNSTSIPTSIHDADDMVSGAGQTISAAGGIKSLWRWQKTTGDFCIICGLY